MSVVIRRLLRINSPIIQGMENGPIGGRIAATLCLTPPQKLNSHREVISCKRRLTSLMTRYLVLYAF